MNKYFSLLRQFDIEAAKRGDMLCNLTGDVGWKYVAGPDCDGKIVTIHIETGLLIGPYLPKEFRMAPLAMVEDKPVYSGDVLYSKYKPSSPLSVDGLVDKDLLALKPSDAEHLCHVSVQWLSWTPQKVKKQGWINICAVSNVSGSTTWRINGRVTRNCDIFADEQSAKKRADQCGDVIATIPIEWEE